MPQSKMYDTLLPSHPRKGGSAFTIQADPKRKSLNEGTLICSCEFLTLKNYYINFLPINTLYTLNQK